jgi:hypothetical protein
MDDNSFRELELKTICPHADRWPTEYMHQKALAAAASETVASVREAYEQLDKIDGNRDLTPEAKKRQRAALAGKMIAKLETSKTISRAREAAEEVLQKYGNKINSNLKPATDPQSIGVHTQIRGQLLAMTDAKQRMSFLERYGNDITLISAALSAPPFVSGLTGAEVALLRNNLEQHAPPEVIKERDFVQKALAEVERGWRAARARIAKRGDLEEGQDGAWSRPSHEQAA